MNLTPQQIQDLCLAIAKHCGIRWQEAIHRGGIDWRYSCEAHWVDTTRVIKQMIGDKMEDTHPPATIANYFEDHNAMAKAKAKLQGTDPAVYLNYLSDLVGNDPMSGLPCDDAGAQAWLWRIDTAPAFNCALAFCKTVGIELPPTT